MPQCNRICERFLKSLRRVRGKGHGSKVKYDKRTYNLRVVRGMSFYSDKEYLRCNQCNIFLHESLYFEDTYAFGMGPKRCPCCNTRLSNRHNKRPGDLVDVSL